MNDRHANQKIQDARQRSHEKHVNARNQVLKIKAALTNYGFKEFNPFSEEMTGVCFFERAQPNSDHQTVVISKVAASFQMQFFELHESVLNRRTGLNEFCLFFLASPKDALTAIWPFRVDAKHALNAISLLEKASKKWSFKIKRVSVDFIEISFERQAIQKNVQSVLGTETQVMGDGSLRFYWDF